jgi:UDP-N-acetylglucosamine 3-dehydrogenase
VAQGVVPIAVVGCGSFGVELSSVISHLDCFEIVAVCDSDETRVRALATTLDVRAFDSLDELLRDSSAQAVALCTPNNLHCAQTMAAAEAGRHIFCEKPMALTVFDCESMLRAAEASGVRLMVGHKRRLRPPYAKVAEFVRTGELGRLVVGSIDGLFYRPPTGWWAHDSIGGGLLCYAGVHDIDFLNHIGGEVSSVFASAPPKIDDQTDFVDAIVVVLNFTSGAVGTLTVSWRFPGVTFQDSFAVRLVLEDGSIHYDPGSATVDVHRIGKSVERFQFDQASGFVEAYRLELTSFADWIRHGSQPLITGWDGLRCVEVIEAAHLSLQTRQPVLLPLTTLGPSRAKDVTRA